jgi:ABC-type phosphate transport system substrate-binding protein
VPRLAHSRRRFLRLLPLAPLLALGPPPAAGREAGYQIIVHPSNPARELSRSFLRDAFLKRVPQWNHGPALRPVDLAARAPAREGFSREVLERSVAEIKRFWQQQIFSGKGVPPPELESEAEVAAFVLKHPGGIGYLPSGADPGETRVVAVR